MRSPTTFAYDGPTRTSKTRRDVHDDSPSNIVSLPFLAAARAASAPALGRFGALYGGSQAMQDVYRRIDKVAPTSATVLIVGESGSGKEVVARTIHDRSDRAKGAFIAVNCGAIPGNLIEAELFGYEKGSFRLPGMAPQLTAMNAPFARSLRS